MINPNIYDAIGTGLNVKEFVYPKYYSFVVSDSDYSNGYAYRYFVKKINETAVIEVSQNNYNEIANNLFSKLFIVWTLIGPERNLYVNGKLYEQGVYEKNLQEINNAAKVMPSIKKYVTNYTQYRKG